MRSFGFSEWVRGKILPHFDSSKVCPKKIMGFPSSQEVHKSCCTHLRADLRFIKVLVHTSFESGRCIKILVRTSRVSRRFVKVAVRGSVYLGGS
jgi:hypothetical protein